MQFVILVAAAVLFWRYFAGESGSGDGASVPSSPDPSDDATSASSYGPVGAVTTGWAKFEGFFQPGSVAQRNNNPVNLKGNWDGVIGHSPAGFAIFATPEQGWAAANQYVAQQATQHPQWTFENFFGKVLGDLQGNPVNNDQGDSDAEAKFVASYSGATATESVASFLGLA